MNIATLIGRLTANPELRYTQQKTPVATMRLAVDRTLSKGKRAEYEAANRPTADFINITVWGKQGEACASYLQKGSQCAVSGRIETGYYTDKEGRKVYTTEIVANQVTFLDSRKSYDDAPIDDSEMDEIPVDEFPF